jgi:iron complex transport system substrate-binding protein
VYPQRIVCLTEETTETLYLLGEGDRVVGVSGYTVRPPEARKKPRVSAFINARFDKIEALSPDLILAFSDLQADIAAELVRRGYPVVTFNQRSVAEIFQMMLMVGGLVGRSEEAQALAGKLQHGLDETREAASKLPKRPRVYFEEWDDPQISAIGWVSELIGIAGGEDVFSDVKRESVQASTELILTRAPDVIVELRADDESAPDLKAWQAVPSVPAVKNHRIVVLTGSDMVTAGPRIGQAAVRLAKALHPEVFE